MTSKQQLGEMLITGKPMQERAESTNLHEICHWEDYDGEQFDIESCEYRLAPKTMYYRAWRFEGEIKIAEYPDPDLSVEEWLSVMKDGVVWLFDHEVTE